MVEPLSTRTKLTWVALLYFAEGFPFGLVRSAFPVYFRSHGVSLAEIGLMSLANLPWTLKFLWAPAVDLWGRRRSWIVACQALLVVSLAVFLLLRPTQAGNVLLVLLITLALFSATQDIAIDAYTIELLDQAALGPANGVRVSTYRVALFCAGGGVVWIAGQVGWEAAFATAAVLLAGSAVLSSQAPATAYVRPSYESWLVAVERTVVGPLRGFWQRPGVIYVMLFILMFKLGDIALGPMVAPFWVDRHLTLGQIGGVLTPMGMVSTITGALVGGRLTKSWGLFRALWVLGIAQAASNLAYAAAAALPSSQPLVYCASFIESFCSGLGTAPFLAFLMSVCDKTQAATQYALLSALSSLTGSLISPFSGRVTQSVGYATYFTATFFLAWPAFTLLPWVKGWIGKDFSDSSDTTPPAGRSP
jgi:PAT family beta-lactamase induction signal transducer AmpG